MYTVNVKHTVLKTKVYNSYNVIMSKTEVDYEKLRMYKSWLKSTVGAANFNYHGEYQQTPFTFNFRKAEDATAFKLKFGL